MKRGLVILFLCFVSLKACSQFDLGVKLIGDLYNEPYPFKHMAIGPSFDVHIPIVKVGISSSILFSARSIEHYQQDKLADVYKFFIIPINAKWEIGYKLFSLYLAAGPYGMIPIGNKIRNELDLAKHSYSCVYGFNMEAGLFFSRKFRICLGYKADLFAGHMEGYYHKANNLYLSLFYNLK